MKETSKSHQMRLERGDFNNYILGNIIDIGCGDDPISPTNGIVRKWDKNDGDGMLLASILDESLDCVYSSHCLEHLVNVETSLTNWARVLRCGGHIYFTIPDWVIYEKERWPSRFNGDHKHSFSLTKTRQEVSRENHHHITNDMLPIIEKLNCKLVSAQLEDNDYDYSKPNIDQTFSGNAMCQICVIIEKL